jgi:hypothetical protein
MDPEIDDYEGTLSVFKKNFEDSYDLNRAPFGLYLHYFWFYNSDGSLNMNAV